MSITPERFAQGLSYEQFKDAMTRNRDRVEANEARVRLDPADVAAFRSLQGPVHVLALAEDWCGDVIANLPVMARVADEAGLALRVFLRDQNKDLMQQYLNQGKYESIPVFAFFDRDFHEIGAFIERPASVTAKRAEQRQRLHAEHPEFGPYGGPADALADDVRARLVEELHRLREADVDWANQEVVRALRAIVERRPLKAA